MVIENAYYRADVHGPFELADLGDLVLEDGPTLRGCQLAYETLGTLNDAKDNAVPATSWYSGNHSVMRETYVGAGRAIDPAEHDVVLVNQLGSGLGWAAGRYAASADVAGGLRRHAGLFALHVLSNDFWTFERWRALGFSTAEDFRVGSSRATSSRWTRPSWSTRRGSGATATSAGTPVETSPQPSAGSPPRPSSCRSAPTSSSRRRTARPSRR